MSSNVIGSDDFDFDEWIEENEELQPIKFVFLKHSATNLEALSFDSPQFAMVLTDPGTLKYSHLIAVALKAINELQSKYQQAIQPSKATKVIKVRVSDAEQKVIDHIDNYFAELKILQNKVNELTNEYKNIKNDLKKDKNKQIGETKDKINQKYDKLIAIINEERNRLISQVDVINDDNDDKKEKDIVKQSLEEIEKITKELNVHSTKCENLISPNVEMNNRKKEIVAIGETVDKSFKKTNKLICENINQIKKYVSENKDIKYDIDLIVNDKQYGEITNNIKTFSTIKIFNSNGYASVGMLRLYRSK